MFKVAYTYGLRRNETRMLDLTDFGRNPEGREFGEYGTLLVRYGKAKKGAPPKRRSVLTVWHWTPHTIEEWISEVRPGTRHSTSRALWPSERGPRIGLQRLDSRFAAYRDAVGLDPALEFHSLRRSYITHLIEDGHDPLFVQHQVGHDHALPAAAARRRPDAGLHPVPATPALRQQQELTVALPRPAARTAHEPGQPPSPPA